MANLRVAKNGEVEILLKYYEAARSNVITRLAARDNSILLYLGGIAGIAAAAFSRDQPYFDILLLIPIISIGIAAFTAQHNYVMDSLYLYVISNIYKNLVDLDYNCIPWEVSEEYTKGRPFSTGTRSVAEGITILLPAIFSTIIYFFAIFNNSKIYPALYQKILFWVGIASCLATVGITVKAYRDSKKHLSSLKKIKKEVELKLPNTKI